MFQRTGSAKCTLRNGCMVSKFGKCCCKHTHTHTHTHTHMLSHPMCQRGNPIPSERKAKTPEIRLPPLEGGVRREQRGLGAAVRRSQTWWCALIPMRRLQGLQGCGPHPHPPGKAVGASLHTQLSRPSSQAGRTALGPPSEDRMRGWT